MKIETVEIPFKIKLSLWTAIKCRIAGIKIRPFPAYDDIVMIADGKRITETKHRGIHIKPLSVSIYEELKSWYEN